MLLSDKIEEFLDNLIEDPAGYSMSEVIGHLREYYDEAKTMERLVKLLEDNVKELEFDK